jgi:HD-like signal output (HDOD) protein
MLIVAQNLPDQFQEALSLAKENQIDLWRAEEEVFHASHEAIGAYLLGLWGLPDPIVETVAFHHCPGKHVDLGFCHLTIVHIAHVLEYEMGIKPFDYPSFAMDESYLEELGLLDRIPVWRNICQEKIHDFI